jgi:hypothetical protein
LRENPSFRQAVLPMALQGDSPAQRAQIILWKQGGVNAIFRPVQGKI